MGKIIIKSISIPYINEKRTIRIYLPNNYDKDEKFYPVVYMHDGQNVFTDETASYNTSWNVKKVLEELEKNGLAYIVVALDNSSNYRYEEYSPWVCEKPKSNFKDGRVYGGMGSEYAKFFVDVLMPLIEKEFRVKKGMENTSLCGSSMGGFITAYMGCKYPDIFGQIGFFLLLRGLLKKHY